MFVENVLITFLETQKYYIWNQIKTLCKTKNSTLTNKFKNILKTMKHTQRLVEICTYMLKKK